MKTNKSSTKIGSSPVLAVFATCVFLAQIGSTQAAVSIGSLNNAAVGYWVSSTGTTLTAGGISIGFFANTPDWQVLSGKSASQAWSSLLTYGYTDVRSLSSVTQPSDWSFTTGGTPTAATGGTVGNVAIASLPSNTRLYAIAFNGGNWNANNTMASATLGGTEWGAVSAFGHSTAAENFVAPADLGSKVIQFKSANLVSSDVLVGSLSPSYATNFSVQLSAIPEPSSASLLALGVAGLVALRARRKS
jgi:hypothetical protein